MSAASRTVQGTPSASRLAIAVGAAVVLAVVGLLLAAGQIGAPKSQAAPAAGAAPVQFDHGWSAASSAAAAAPVLHDHGLSSASTGSSVARHPLPKSPKATLSTGIAVSGSNGGGILYVGIPYPAPRNAPVGGSRGVRLPK